MADDPYEWVRIKDKDTKHESTIARMSFRAEQQEILDKDATHPDGTPLPPKPHITKGQQAPATSKDEETVK